MRNYLSEAADKLKRLASNTEQLPNKEVNIIRETAQRDIADLIAFCESDELLPNRRKILRQLIIFARELQSPQLLTQVITKERYGKNGFLLGIMQDITHMSREQLTEYAGQTEAVLPGGIILRGEQKKEAGKPIESQIRRLLTISQDYANKKRISLGFLLLPADNLRATLENTFGDDFELNVNNTIRIKRSVPGENYPEEIYSNPIYTESGEIIYIMYRESDHDLPGASPQASAEESFMPGLSPAPNPSS